MRKIQEQESVNCIDSEDLRNAAEMLLNAAQIVINLQTPVLETVVNLTIDQQIKTQIQFLQKNPLLVTGMAVLSTFERFRVDYVYQQNTLQLLLQDLVESIDCAGANSSLDDEIILTALSPDECLTALKERWLHNHPQHSEKDYIAAINEFEKLLGL